MALEIVRVYAVDENSDALEGVLVQVYDATGATFITQNTTAIVGSDAYAEFSLDGNDPPTEYTIRLSKTGVAFDGLLGDDSKTPQLIEIYSPAAAAPSGTNWFTVQGQTFTRPAATDPRLCKASGFFKDPAGRPLPNLDIKIMSVFCPLLVDGNAVMGRYINVTTDSDGYACVTLYRGGEYQVIIESFEDVNREVVVPDASSVNLPDLLFPVVDEVVFTPGSVSIAVDAYQDVDITITDTLGNELDPLDGDVVFTSEDTSIVTTALIGTGELRVLGVAAGSTDITVERADSSINAVPDPLTFTPLTVTVT